jgi:hypothetical protein
MNPWKAVSLILFALAVAVAVYGLILVRRGFSALATPSRLRSSWPQSHAKWPCHPRIADFAIPIVWWRFPITEINSEMGVSQ